MMHNICDMGAYKIRQFSNQAYMHALHAFSLNTSLYSNCIFILIAYRKSFDIKIPDQIRLKIMKF